MGSYGAIHVCSLPFKGRVGVGMGKSIKLNTGGKQ